MRVDTIANNQAMWLPLLLNVDIFLHLFVPLSSLLLHLNGSVVVIYCVKLLLDLSELWYYLLCIANDIYHAMVGVK